MVSETENKVQVAPSRLAETQKTIMRIRYCMFPFALFQVLTYYIPYPDGVFAYALGISFAILITTIVLHFIHRRVVTEEGQKQFAILGLSVDSAAIFAFVSIYTFDVDTAIFVLLYIIPLEAATVFGRRAALISMGIVTALYIGREYLGHVIYGHDFLIMSITFRMGMGFVFAGIAGALATSWFRAHKRTQSMYDTAQENVRLYQEIDTLKNNFLGAIAHELRTPLTSILGFAHTLRQRADTLDETEKIMLTHIVDESHHLNNLLTDLLDVNKLGQGLIEIKPERFSMSALLHERAQHVTALTGRNILVSSQDAEVFLDKAHVERIVENLLFNATKYTPDETPITASAASTIDGVIICVGDRGPGVEDEYKELIFRAFQRGNKKDLIKPGTGIGLSLIAQLAALHGGRAWVEDRVGGGAVFKVEMKNQEPIDDVTKSIARHSKADNL